jgi:hypothetical protein
LPVPGRCLYGSRREMPTSLIDYIVRFFVFYWELLVMVQVKCSSWGITSGWGVASGWGVTNASWCNIHDTIHGTMAIQTVVLTDRSEVLLSVSTSCPASVPLYNSPPEILLPLFQRHRWTVPTPTLTPKTHPSTSSTVNRVLCFLPTCRSI